MAKTEMVFILDKSGSMAGLEDDTIGGFNSLIEKQRALQGEAIVTTILFDSAISKLHDGVSIRTIEPMTSKDYTAGGCTALLDAVGATISTVHKRQKRMKGKPDHTVFVIITDGAENSSREFSYQEVQKMIRNRRKNSGWEFIFLGANMDAIETAGSLGIHKDRAANYHADRKGTAVNFEAIGSALCTLRENGAIEKDWCDEIVKDFEGR